jgi:hypothetical protein
VRAASEFIEVAPGIVVWETYEPSIKSDLSSTAIRTSAGWIVVDPVPLAPAALSALEAAAPINSIVVTNSNHLREALSLAQSGSRPIFASDGIHSEVAAVQPLPRSSEREGVRFIPVDGAAAGEIALYIERDGGSIVVGDALINFGSHGFTLLPRKYCQDQKLLRASLANLARLPFSRLFFAHGTPILTGANARLAAVLDQRGLILSSRHPAAGRQAYDP